jgi:hypothetical protein
MRRVQAVPLSPRNLGAFTERLRNSDPQTWPKFLNRAWSNVAEKLEKPDAARETVVGAVTAAHTCAVAVSGRARSNQRSVARQEVSSAILSISNCIKRIRAPIRHRLNEVAQIEFHDGHADSEAIFNFFNRCTDVVSGLPGETDVVRIVNALGVPKYEIEKSEGKIATEPTLKLISDWESMHPSARAIVEESLGTIVKDPAAPLSARDIFSTIACSLAVGAINEVQENSVDLLLTYVAVVAEIWRQAGLYPGRASRDGDPEYRSQFHVFLELVLLDQFNPRSRLFDRLNDEELMRNREFLDSLLRTKDLSKDERAETGIGPRYQWLINERHIRDAIEQDSKKDT